MNTSILKVGQVIKNYDELCYLLEEQPRECSKHKKHFDEFKMFFNYHREGNNIIIDEIYQKPKIKTNITQIEYDEYINNWKKENYDLLNDTSFKKIFLEIIPMNKTQFDWGNSVNKKVFFVYSTIQGYLTIIDWELNKKDKNCTLKVEYNDNIYYIKSLYFKKCGLSKIFNFKPFEFKYNIGDNIINENKDITIIDRKREYIKKRKSYRSLYKYKCNVCGFNCEEHYKNGEYQEEYWADESSLEQSGCLCCNRQIVVQGINDIATTDPWMIPIVGLEISKIYSHGSTKSIFPICPNCGKTKSKKLTIGKIYSRSGFSCSCSDKFPFGEKFMSNFLYKMNIGFISEYSKTNEIWCDKYRYDFYFELNNEKYIIETHGMQHYQNSTGWNSNTKTLEEEQENDRIKKELALANGIKKENYIVIDTRYDSLEWIRNSILSSELSKIFDLNIIDWNYIMSQSIKSLVVEIVKYISNNPNYKKIDLVRNFNTGYITINSYLNQAKDCGLL